MLSTSGLQFRDWSADYRLFEHERIEMDQLFAPIRNTLIEQYPKQQAISVVLDDTRLHKSGKKVYGTKWLRDPLGPKFQTNFIWGQRFIQASAILPEKFNEPSRARAIPIDFHHCPLTPNLGKKTTPEQITQWKKQRQCERLTVIGLQKLTEIRAQIDLQEGGRDRQIIASVDGGYTNTSVFKNLPDRVSLIGRLRKDAKIFSPPDPSMLRKPGRCRVYGTPLPTPEQILNDNSIPWKTVPAFAAGRLHDFKIKTIAPIRWRGAGSKNLRLVIIHPLAYRLSKNQRTRYRDPGYLICSDTDLDVQQLLQNYIWRWEIEVNFRDQKTLLGVGEAQTRTPITSATVPAFMVAAYSYLELAAHLTYPKSNDALVLPSPLWRKSRPSKRMTTNQMISLLRTQLWGKALGISNLNDFVTTTTTTTKSILFENSLKSAVLYALQ